MLAVQPSPITIAPKRRIIHRTVVIGDVPV